MFNCQKNDPGTVTPQDVVFSAYQVDPGSGVKSTGDWDWICQDLDPVYARIKIGTKDYTPSVFMLDGKLYTQAIKLEPGTYSVSEFLIMDDMGTPGDVSDDQIYMATPEAGAEFAQYTAPDVPFDITVTAFTKLEVPIEVLCFIPDVYQSFGFDWFVISEYIIREQCFFGDFCVKHPADYLGSLYGNQSTGLKIDMPAIFSIKVYK
jgi:hypothetical protein